MPGAQRPEQHRDLPAVANRFVGEHPHAGHAQTPGDEQQVATPRVNLERLPQRPEHVEALSLADTGHPFRSAAHRPEMERDDASGGIRGVDRERAPQDQTGVVARANVDELAGP